MKHFRTNYKPAAILLPLLLFLGPKLWSQTYNPDKQFTVNELKRDFSVIRSALEYSHPGAYWYNTPEKLKKYLDSAYAQINRPMTEREFYWFISPVLAQVQCGHTYPRMSQAYETSDAPRPTYLPFEFFWDGERLFIVRNGSTDSTLVPGDEVLAIGGVPVPELAREARNSQSADGDNAAWKNVMLDMFLIEEVYLNRHNGKPPFRLTVSTQNGVRETEVTARKRKPTTQPVKPAPQLSKKEQQKEDKRREEEERAGYIKFRFTGGDSSAAILKISGFGYEKVYGVDYQKKHRSIFKAMSEKNVQNLVIDLRGNSGGNGEIAEDLMSYLVDKNIKVADRNELYTVNLAYMDTLIQYFEKQPQSHGFQKSRLKKIGENLYRFKFEGKPETKPQGKYRFGGNVYVITDGWVFSAGSLFVSSLRAQRKITVVGTETGGGAVGCSGGRISRIILPNTGIRISFPHFRMYAVTDAKADGHGVIPDYPVRRVWLDRAEHRDPEMKKVFELMRGAGTH